MIGRLPSCILFDLDGTLVDSLPGIEFSVREAFAACNLPLAKQNLRSMIGPPIRAILSRAGNIVEKNNLDALERAFRASYDSEGWRKTTPFPEAILVVRMMHERGHRLFVVSNKPRHASRQTLEGQGILECFEAIITRDSRMPEYEGKEEMIAALIDERSIAKHDCILVGDTAEDANAAATAGIDFIWMTHGYGNPSQMASIPVALILDSFSQLLPLIEQGAFS
jgi:phosphoglycolate phosphatase